MLRGERGKCLAWASVVCEHGVGGKPMTQPLTSKMLHAAPETRGWTPTLGVCSPAPPPSPSKATAAPLLPP